ncbi:MAG TPA: TetR/AcrR family transcriptional regulator [Mycobacterium sp.]
MATGEHPPRRGRGRRPADEVRAEILAAAGDLLIAGGMGAFTIDKVAAHSGASKMTIYKWWPSKGALALDGYFHRVEDQLEFPDTGDIEVDLRAQLYAFLAVLRQSPAGPVIAELIGQAQSDPDLKAAYLQSYSAPRRALAVSALETAKARGQLRADLDPETVVDQLWGACYHRLLLPDQPLTEQFVDALVDNLFRGIAPR